MIIGYKMNNNRIPAKPKDNLCVFLLKDTSSTSDNRAIIMKIKTIFKPTLATVLNIEIVHRFAYKSNSFFSYMSLYFS